MNPSTSQVSTQKPKEMCLFCGKEYAKNYIKRHVSTFHLGERSFFCMICDKTFKEKHHLLRHEKTHRKKDSANNTTYGSSATNSTETEPNIQQTIAYDTPSTSRIYNDNAQQTLTNTSLSNSNINNDKNQHHITDNTNGACETLTKAALEGYDVFNDDFDEVYETNKDLLDLYEKYHGSIISHSRVGPNFSSYNIQWADPHAFPNWDEHLWDIFNSQTGRFKINYSHHLVLKEKVTGDLSLYHSSAQNHTCLTHPRLISCKNDFKLFLEDINDYDIFEETKMERPNSRFSVIAIPASTFYLFHLKDYPIGCCDEEIPDFIKNNKYINVLYKNQNTSKIYKDNMCLFRCLALQSGEDVRHLETKTKQLLYTWLRHSDIFADNFNGVTLFELDEVEACFSINIDVYEYINIKTNPLLVPLRRSENNFDTGMKLLKFNNHFMYIIDFDLMSHAIACPKCQKLFKEKRRLFDHERKCIGYDSKSVYVGGVYSPSKSVIQDLVSAGFVIDSDYCFPYRASFDYETYFTKDGLKENTRTTTYSAKHNILSCAVSSNVPGFCDGKCFISEGDSQKVVDSMMDYLNEISDASYKILTRKFKDVIEDLKRQMKKENSEGQNVNLDDKGDDSDDSNEGDDDVDNDNSEHSGYIPTAKLYARFMSYLRQLPVIGFNSSRYDLNVFKVFLIKHLYDKSKDSECDMDDSARAGVDPENGTRSGNSSTALDSILRQENETIIACQDNEPSTSVGNTRVDGTAKRKMKRNKRKVKRQKLEWEYDRYSVNFIVKRNNQYVCFSTDTLKFLDVTSYLAPGYSYSSFLKAFGVEEEKFFFPYEHMTDLKVLDEKQLPRHEAFYSDLKGCNISNEEYELCKKVWNENNMKTMRDFLVFYNLADVKPFLCGLERMSSVYSQLGIDLFKDAISVPGISLIYLFKTIDKTVYFSLFNEKQKDVHELLRRNITGGPSIIFSRYLEKGETKIRGIEDKIVQTIEGYDANALYLWGLMQDMPTEHPTIRRVETGFKAEKNEIYGRMSREWLEYTAHTEEIDIQHQFNGKEKQVGKRRIRVDGWTRDSKTGQVSCFQFMGCWWHCCRECFPNNRQTIHPHAKKTFDEVREKTDEILSYLISLGYKVIVEWECSWKKRKASDLEVRRYIDKHLTPNYPFGYDQEITEDDIKAAIKNDKLFGLVQCDITIPDSDDSREFWSELQPIMKNVNVSIDDIGELMKDYATEHGLMKQPRRTLIGSFFGEGIVLITPLLKWYMAKGLKVSKIKLIVEYKRKRCFQSFGEEVTKARIASDLDPSKAIMAETFKLLGNSAYGKTITNIANHREISIVPACDIQQKINDKRFRKMTSLDDKDELFEVEMTKNTMKWNLPIQIGFFVYGYAKLRLLQFYYDFIDKYIDRCDFVLAEVDTDSCYMGLSGNTLEDVIRPELREEFYNNWNLWFPAQACAEHQELFVKIKTDGGKWIVDKCDKCVLQSKIERRKPGLFKTEFKDGSLFVGLCPKTYFIKSEHGSHKMSSKGLNKKQNELTAEKYVTVLENKESGGGVNVGFKCDGTGVVSYRQERKSLSYLYIKRIVKEDGVTTGPILI